MEQECFGLIPDGEVLCDPNVPLEVFLTQPPSTRQRLGRGWLSGARLGLAEGLLSGVQDEPQAADAQMTPSCFGCSLLASQLASNLSKSGILSFFSKNWDS